MSTIGELANSTAGVPMTLTTAIAGEDITNDRMKVRDALGFTNLSASAQIKSGAGVVAGFVVNSNTSGTLKLWDSLTAANTIIMNTYTFVTATSQVVTFPKPVRFSTGLYATIGGTADITIIWE